MITGIVNHSLPEGYVPDQWMDALVIPYQSRKDPVFTLRIIGQWVTFCLFRRLLRRLRHREVMYCYLTVSLPIAILRIIDKRKELLI